MKQAISYLLLVSHAQDVFPLLAPFSLALFVLVNSFPWLRLSLLARPDVQVAALTGVYTLVIALVNCGDLIAEAGPGFFGGDGRATYMAAFYLGLRHAISCRPAAGGELLRAGVLATTAIALFSIAAYATGPIYFMEHPLGAMQLSEGRVAVGLLGTKNSFAGSVSAALTLAVALGLVHPRVNVIGLNAQRFATAVLFAALMVSGSRGFLIGTILGVSVAAIFFADASRRVITINVQRTALAIAATLAALGVFTAINPDRVFDVVAGRDMNVTRRFELFKYAGDLWGRSLLTGIGPGNMKQPDLRTRTVVPYLVSVRRGGEKQEEGFEWVGDLPIGQHAHNVLLQAGVDYGLIGVVLLTLWYGLGLRGNPSDPPPVEGLRRLGLTLLAGCLASGLSAGYTLTNPSSSFLVLATMAAYRAGSEQPPGAVEDAESE